MESRNLEGITLRVRKTFWDQVEREDPSLAYMIERVIAEGGTPDMIVRHLRDAFPDSNDLFTLKNKIFVIKAAAEYLSQMKGEIRHEIE